MEFSSPRFCRTNNRHSSVPSCGCAFVETRNKRSKTFAVVELPAKLVRGVFAGNPADAHAIKHAIRRIILLNKDGRVGSAEALAETLGVGAGTETDLLRFTDGAGAGGIAGASASVERFAASAVSAGVSEGCAGGGWRRSAIGLRDAQPEK